MAHRQKGSLEECETEGSTFADSSVLVVVKSSWHIVFSAQVINAVGSYAFSVTNLWDRTEY